MLSDPLSKRMLRVMFLLWTPLGSAAQHVLQHWWTFQHIRPSLWSDNNLYKQQHTFWVFLLTAQVARIIRENNERLYLVKHLFVGGLINRFIVWIFIQS